MITQNLFVKLTKYAVPWPAYKTVIFHPSGKMCQVSLIPSAYVIVVIILPSITLCGVMVTIPFAIG